MVCNLYFNSESLSCDYLLHSIAPEDAPANVTVVNTSSSSVMVIWTAPSIQNGIIIHYTLYVDYADGSAIVQVNTLSDTNYTVDGLQPYQLVTVQVSASTAAGEGPLSQPTMGRASEEGTVNLQL